jgi:hypothetical protein
VAEKERTTRPDSPQVPNGERISGAMPYARGSDFNGHSNPASTSGRNCHVAKQKNREQSTGSGQ